MNKIVLNSEGFQALYWNPDNKVYHRDLIDLNSFRLLIGWNREFSIEGTVLLADLVKAVRKMSPELREIVGKITSANLN